MEESDGNGSAREVSFNELLEGYRAAIERLLKYASDHPNVEADDPELPSLIEPQFSIAKYFRYLIYHDYSSAHQLHEDLKNEKSQLGDLVEKSETKLAWLKSSREYLDSCIKVANEDIKLEKWLKGNTNTDISYSPADSTEYIYDFATKKQTTSEGKPAVILHPPLQPGQERVPGVFVHLYQTLDVVSYEFASKEETDRFNYLNLNARYISVQYRCHHIGYLLRSFLVTGTCDVASWERIDQDDENYRQHIANLTSNRMYLMEWIKHQVTVTGKLMPTVYRDLETELAALGLELPYSGHKSFRDSASKKGITY